MAPLVAFDGPVWRLVPATFAAVLDAPARAPEGRFHHQGQFAIYASLTPEGAEVAMRRYRSDGVARLLVPMRLVASRVADRRGDPDASLVWQDHRAAGAPAPTWRLPDAARSAGAQAMLYASRTRPDLAHVVVFAPGYLFATGLAVPVPG